MTTDVKIAELETANKYISKDFTRLENTIKEEFAEIKQTLKAINATLSAMDSRMDAVEDSIVRHRLELVELKESRDNISKRLTELEDARRESQSYIKVGRAMWGGLVALMGFISLVVGLVLQLISSQ